jgi:ADP-ribose pyrophosphatase YjhB (NUDIX family)
MTAAREAQEETGLEVRIKCLGTVYYFEDDPRGNGLLMVYDATVTAGEIRTDGREIATAGFFAPDDLPAPLCRGGHDQAIREWQARALERWDPGEPLRYCPHCTCALEDRVAYGRERPVCPTCGYVHFLSPKVGVSVLVEEAGRVLLVQRAIEPGLGQWSLPSGFIEWDEPPETAAAREVAEETGLTVEDARLLSVEHYTEDFRGQGLNITYRASVAGGALVAADDAARVRFFAPDDLPQPEHIAFESHRAVLAHWAGGRAPEGA